MFISTRNGPQHHCTLQATAGVLMRTFFNCLLGNGGARTTVHSTARLRIRASPTSSPNWWCYLNFSRSVPDEIGALAFTLGMFLVRSALLVSATSARVPLRRRRAAPRTEVAKPHRAIVASSMVRWAPVLSTCFSAPKWRRNIFSPYHFGSSDIVS